jgi:hypothetical protein
MHEATVGEIKQRDMYHVCAELGAVAIIHSDALSAAHGNVRMRREAFRRLLLDGTDHPGSSGKGISPHIRDQVEERLQAHLDATGDFDTLMADVMEKPDQAAKIVADVLMEVLRENWHLVEPAQIVNYPRRGTEPERMSDATLRQVRRLLELNQVACYGDA